MKSHHVVSRAMGMKLLIVSWIDTFCFGQFFFPAPIIRVICFPALYIHAFVQFACVLVVPFHWFYQFALSHVSSVLGVQIFPILACLWFWKGFFSSICFSIFLFETPNIWLQVINCSESIFKILCKLIDVYTYEWCILWSFHYLSSI